MLQAVRFAMEEPAEAYRNQPPVANSRDSWEGPPCPHVPPMLRLDVLLEVCRMAKTPSIIPVSDLRQDAARVLKKTRTSDEPVFITQRGRATAVLMSIDAFERSATE